MIVGASLPEKISGGDVECVDIAAQITDVNGSRADYGCNADAGDGGVGPIDASGARIERIDGAVRIADENPSADDRGCSKGGGGAGKPEGPFKFEMGRGLAS